MAKVGRPKGSRNKPKNGRKTKGSKFDAKKCVCVKHQKTNRCAKRKK